MAIEQPPIWAVLDTTVIIAALKSRSPSSPTAESLRRWQNDEFTLVYSIALREEYAAKIDARGVDAERGLAFLELLDQRGIRVEVDCVPRLIKDDEDDDIVIACALSGRATHLVTYDPHFLVLGREYQGVLIVDGLRFLFAVRGDKAQQ